MDSEPPERDPEPSERPCEFRIQVENEEELIRMAVAEANKNVDSTRPGEFWLRLNGEVKNHGKQHTWTRVYHVDVINQTIEIVETYDGRETGRLGLPLDVSKYS